ncbi:MAG: DUF1972 domain-containing protein [Planctomycetes bacterium]|nr:DUF1972 domain-containing protein [Planctomycetota bacterium]
MNAEKVTVCSGTSGTESAANGKERVKPFKIVILGTRGVPARYGGFETAVQEIGRRLDERGHDVTVYCRSGPGIDEAPTYCGMKRIFAPCFHLRSLETLSHTFFSVLMALFRPADVFFACNVANIPALIPLRLRRTPLIVNTDGLEWKRAKWGRAAKLHFKISERMTTWFATRIITDSRTMGEYYREEYHMDSTTIAYGAEVQNSVNPKLLKPLGVKPGEYFLQVTRFEPENNPLLTVQAFLELNTDKKLVMVGGAAYSGEYQKQLTDLAGDRVIMPGFVYDDDLLRELWTNCHAYIHGNEVGGTNPALLQAMGCGCFVLCRDVNFNREVLGDCGRFFLPEKKALYDAMRWSLDNADQLDEKRRAAQQRIRDFYSWDDVADRYERLCHELIAART